MLSLCDPDFLRRDCLLLPWERVLHVDQSMTRQHKFRHVILMTKVTITSIASGSRWIIPTCPHCLATQVIITDLVGFSWLASRRKHMIEYTFELVNLWKPSDTIWCNLSYIVLLWKRAIGSYLKDFTSDAIWYHRSVITGASIGLLPDGTKLFTLGELRSALCTTRSVPWRFLDVR